MHKIIFAGMAAAMAFLAAASNAIPAFPGAEGYGSQTPGGRGGKVLIVTNTNAAGAGSFQLALQTTGPRIIVFRVSGVITLNSEILLENANYSNFTVAGQTSPGGITVRIASGTPIWQYTSNLCHDEVWRFLRFRVATANNDHAFEHYMANNFIIDHCEFSGGADECLDICRSHDFTIQWCIIANASGGQNYGWLLAYNPLYYMSFHHSLIANFGGRCGPEMHTSNEAAVNNGNFDYRNNVCYNSGATGFFACANLGGPYYLNVVGCTFKSGPNTNEGNLDPPAYTVRPLYFASYAYPYQADNAFLPYKNNDTVTGDLCDRRYGRSPVNQASAISMPAVTTLPRGEAYAAVLAKAGALPRDSMSARTVRQVLTRTGSMNKVDDPLITAGPAAPADADNDGMPDCWETAMGFNPNDSAGKNADHDGDGYTNIEEYINDMALSLIGDPVQNVALSGGCPVAAEHGTGPGPGLSRGLDYRTADAVYDMRGRRIESPRQSGIYLYRIGGKFLKRVYLP